MYRAEDILTPSVVTAMRAHAIAAYPAEMCGYIRNGVYHELTNIAESLGFDPTITAVPPGVEMGRLLLNGEIDCFVHSHTNGLNQPSKLDMEFQLRAQIPCAIILTNGQATTTPFVWGDQVVPPPLLGRQFRHGVTDCYAAIRHDFILSDNVKLLDMAREWNWWTLPPDQQPDFYGQFERAGFAEVDEREVIVGDCALIQLPRANVIHHAGRLRPNGLIFSHGAVAGPGYQPRQLSKLTPLFDWRPYIMKWVRYVGPA